MNSQPTSRAFSYIGNLILISCTMYLKTIHLILIITSTNIDRFTKFVYRQFPEYHTIRLINLRSKADEMDSLIYRTA